MPYTGPVEWINPTIVGDSVTVILGERYHFGIVPDNFSDFLPVSWFMTVIFV